MDPVVGSVTGTQPALSSTVPGTQPALSSTVPAVASFQSPQPTNSQLSTTLTLFTPAATASTTLEKGTRPGSQCPRLDLMAEIPGLAENRDKMLRLEKFSSFDHVFEPMRKDQRHTYLKSQPLRRAEDEKPVCSSRNLLEIMQAPEQPFNNKRLSEEIIEKLIERVSRSSPIPKLLIKRNKILTDEAADRQKQKEEQLQQKSKKPIVALGRVPSVLSMTSSIRSGAVVARSKTLSGAADASHGATSETVLSRSTTQPLSRTQSIIGKNSMIQRNAATPRQT